MMMQGNHVLNNYSVKRYPYVTFLILNEFIILVDIGLIKVKNANLPH